MPLVVRAVVVAVQLVQFADSGHALVDGGGRGHIQHERLHLRAQEVIRTRGAERGKREELLARQELVDDVGVRVVADHAVIARRDGAQVRRQCRRFRAPLVTGERDTLGDGVAERLTTAVPIEERLRRAR